MIIRISFSTWYTIYRIPNGSLIGFIPRIIYQTSVRLPYDFPLTDRINNIQDFL